MADVAGIVLVMCVQLCRVQEAVKTTVLGLLGSLPRQAFETATLTTGDALANLMFQLQMTGYMFKNAEYRMSLQNSLRSGASEVPKGLITGESHAVKLTFGARYSSGATLEGVDASSLVPMDEDGNIIIKKPTISGKDVVFALTDQVKLTYESGQEVEVDASAYMAELATQQFMACQVKHAEKVVLLAAFAQHSVVAVMAMQLPAIA
eukprot:9569-Heterococcus_DN1.PRE.1